MSSPTSTSPPLKILLTGATGFIGGSILNTLLTSTAPALQNSRITCLLRDAARASKLTSHYGSRVQLAEYKDLDDVEATTRVTSQHDIVINTTLGFHQASAVALVKGLGERRKEVGEGREVWMIHTSGTSNLADTPFTGTWVDQQYPDGREFDDEGTDVYGYEKEREKGHGYPQRTTELAVIDEGAKLGVKTLVIMSPTIYGSGSGLFNTLSIQVPAYARTALGHGRSIVIGSGSGIWDHVHIADLADLYTLCILDILTSSGSSLPHGQRGIIFSAAGRASWHSVAQGVADACVAEGELESAEVESMSLEEGGKVFYEFLEKISPEHVEAGLSSNSRTVASVAKKLGWKPTRGEEAWKKGFGDDVRMVLEKRRGGK